MHGVAGPVHRTVRVDISGPIFPWIAAQVVGIGCDEGKIILMNCDDSNVLGLSHREWRLHESVCVALEASVFFLVGPDMNVCLGNGCPGPPVGCVSQHLAWSGLRDESQTADKNERVSAQTAVS